MAAQKKRNTTSPGMGAVASGLMPRAVAGVDTTPPVSGPNCPAPTSDAAAADPRPLGVRDTIPVPGADLPGANDSGVRRRFTVAVGTPRQDSWAPNCRAARETFRRGERPAVRVDEVGSTTLVAPKDTSRRSRPRVINPNLGATAPLTAREAFLITFIDGTLTVQEIVDAAGATEPEVVRFLARLLRMGIASLS